ncbi:MAG: hypothetical protein A4S14_01765 [Proteobacteria bacterium SG_bin9]|nr:MAG: hypothetical protein A4S14_01765 [Proteobacteria bacterium SG_bin9]
MSITENRRLVALVRKIVAWPNRHPSLQPFSNWMMRRLARVAMKKANAKPAADLAELHQEWSRSAPAMASYKLTKIEGDTAYAEVHSECALRGSGDVGACFRMMEYDREIMRKVGGELVILESQASPGRTFCTVAMRRKGASMADFTPAHLKKQT